MNSLEHLEFLRSIKQHAQKTNEWLEQRKNRLTSSDAATALDANPYKSSKLLLEEKCGLSKKWEGNMFTRHGEQYEDEAIEIYEGIMGKKTYTFGMISYGDVDPVRKVNSPHLVDEQYHFLGGSPDGIAVDIENPMKPLVMLEIKCPLRRKIVHGKIPPYYLPQVQLNMFILDLKVADFIEYIPPSIGGPDMNIVRIYRDDEWFFNSVKILRNFWDSVLSTRASLSQSAATFESRSILDELAAAAEEREKNDSIVG